MTRPPQRRTPEASARSRPPRRLIEVLYDDEHVLAISKPAGLACVPTRRADEPTVKSVLQAGLGDEAAHVRLIHRIDQDTSGVLLLARTRDAQRRLTEQFVQRRVRKTYLALVNGVPDEPAGVVEAPIAKGRGDSTRVRINFSRGKPAVTEWEVLERFARYALLRCRPRTGRQHQIRAHLQLAGYPLAVDELYGGQKGLMLSSFKADYHPGHDEERPLIGRLSLHAESIEFEHPADGRTIRVEAPLPKDFRAAINQLRRHGTAGPPLA